MLNARQRAEDYDSQARPLSELVPWMTLLTPNTVLNKDGTLLALYRFRGRDIDGMQDYDVEHLADSFSRALSILDDRMVLTLRMRRVRAPKPAADSFPDPISQRIEDVWTEDLTHGDWYVNEHVLALTYTPPSGAAGFIDTLYRRSDESGSIVRGLRDAIRETFSPERAFEGIVQDMAIHLREFDAMLSKFETANPDLGLQRLAQAELVGWLHSMVSPASCLDLNAGIGEQPDPDWFYLDTALGSDTVEPLTLGIRFRGVYRDRYAALLTVKTWPRASGPGLLDELLSVPHEIEVSQTWRPLAFEAAQKHIKDVRRKHFNARKGIMTHIRELITNTVEDRGDEARDAAIDETTGALQILAESRLAGFYNLTLIVYGDSIDQVQRAVEDVSKRLHQYGFILMRENMHALSAWASTLFGQWAEAVRWVMFFGRNAADLALIHAVDAGDPINRHLSEQLGREVRALTTFRTQHATPFHFNLHHKDLGNTIIIGPSGAGKSVMANFLLTQARRYQPCRVVIFDKDYSCRIPALAQGGSHLDVGRSRISLNPLRAIDSPSEREWIHSWLELLIGARGYRLTAQDGKDLWEAIDGMAALPKEHRRLSALASLLPTRLADELSEWVGDGPLARWFDNTEDALSFSELTCIEMGQLFQSPQATRAFLDYAFHRVDALMDGTPTFIYIEEAWFMLEEARFASKINDWLRTVRKRNGAVMMSSQSLDELAKSKVFAAILSSVPTRIFLPNPNAPAARKLYQEAFLLNDMQLNQIAKALPKRDYYIVTPTMSRLVQVSFPKEILTWLRSDGAAQSAFERATHEGDALSSDNWRMTYEEALQ